MESLQTQPWTLTVALAIAAATLALSWKATLGRRKQSVPLPPGPKGLPVIGNLRDLPTHHEWLTYREWSEQYGDIFHISVFGQPIIIVSSQKVASDLFDHRSSIYSDRPTLPMLDLMGFDFNFALASYGPRWRRLRKLFHSQAHKTASTQYEGLHLREARVFLRQLLEKPDDLPDLLRAHFASSILDMCYGIKIDGPQDRFIRLPNRVMEFFQKAIVPGAFLVDAMPILKNVPAWVPGAGFQTIATNCRKAIYELVHEPYNYVKEQQSAGRATPSMTSRLLETVAPENRAAGEEDIMNALGVSYIAGADTSYSTLLTFFLVMTLHPSIQAKAQAELDAVVGLERLPDFSDRARLPYISALIWELFRWQPVAPLGVPHATSEEDVYEGYRIPKGAIVIGNIWAMLRDLSIYPDPEEFRPERFLATTSDGRTELDPSAHLPHTVFGFGRRACAGRHIAEQGLFATISSVLAAFNISPVMDNFGKPALPTVEMSGGSVSHPLPFNCAIKPRSQRVVELLRDSGVPA